MSLEPFLEAAERCHEVSERAFRASASHLGFGRKSAEREAEELSEKLWHETLPYLQAALSEKADAKMTEMLLEFHELLREGPNHPMVLKEDVSILLKWAAVLARIGKILRYLYRRLWQIAQPPAVSQISVYAQFIDRLGIGDQTGTNMSGTKYDVKISSSTIGAQAVGDNATATGTVVLGQVLSRDQFEGEIRNMKKALIDDEDSLDTVVIEALGQFLRMAREIQVENKTLAEAQAEMKEVLDEIWAEKTIKPMLPSGTKFAAELAKSPVMAEVAKFVLSGG